MSAAANANWQFAPTGGGILYGYNNASTEHFKQDTIGKLVREAVQNSLDAHEDGLGPVIVDLRECDINTGLIGPKSLKEHLRLSLKQVSDKGQEEGKQAYRKALSIINKPTIPCLAIIDRNTTGLKGRKWDSLIKEEGTPEKDGPGAHGGSFGIGKNASYNVAGLHTVIYCTRYATARQGRVERMTGRAQLVSHPGPDSGEMLQHIGFYADEAGNPLAGPDIPAPFRLDETGTGLWITGFQLGRTNWTEAAVRAVVDNFFYAIHHRKLEVNLFVRGAQEPAKVCYDTIDSILENRRGSQKTTHYYRAIRQEPVGKTESVGSIGPLDVYISNEKGAPRRVAYINRRGMLITDTRERRRSNPFHPGSGGAWPDFAAVVTATEDDTDKQIRRMENPAHDVIAVDRLPEGEREAVDGYLRMVGTQIREIIDQAIREQDMADISNVTELSDMFRDLDPALPENQELNSRTIIYRAPTPSITTVEDESDLDEEQHVDDEQSEYLIDPDPPEPPGPPGPPPPGPPNPGPVTPPAPPAPNPVTPRKTETRHTIREAVIMRTGASELSVALMTTPDAGRKISFTIEPGGEETIGKERRITIEDVKRVEPANAQVEHTNGIITVTTPNGHKGAVVLTVNIGQNSTYTGYGFSERQAPSPTSAKNERLEKIREMRATNANQTEIAEALGISRQRVSQLVRKHGL